MVVSQDVEEIPAIPSPHENQLKNVVAHQQRLMKMVVLAYVSFS